MTEPALELTGFCAYYGKMTAVHEVSLRVDAGTAVGILGPNGAGKSSLLKGVAGFLRSSGAVRIGGREASRLSPVKRRRTGLALVPQQQAVIAELSVGENLRLSWLTGRRASPFERTVSEALEIFPALKGRLDEPAGNLSGGQRQMLAASRGFVSTCDILLLDEPTAGLSPKLIGELVDAIKALNDAGLTVLLVEQNVSVVERVCEHIHVLNGGQVVWDGPTTSIDREEIGDLYAGVSGVRVGADGDGDG